MLSWLFEKCSHLSPGCTRSGKFYRMGKHHVRSNLLGMRLTQKLVFQGEGHKKVDRIIYTGMLKVILHASERSCHRFGFSSDPQPTDQVTKKRLNNWRERPPSPPSELWHRARALRRASTASQYGGTSGATGCCLLWMLDGCEVFGLLIAAFEWMCWREQST